MWKTLRNITFIVVISCSSLLIASEVTEMSLITCGDTNKVGKRGVALHFKHIEENNPGSPLWEAKVMFNEETSKTSYIPYKTGLGSGVIGVVGGWALGAFPPLLGGAIVVTGGKYVIDKCTNYFSTTSKVKMLYSIRSDKKLFEENLFLENEFGKHFPEKPLPNDQEEIKKQFKEAGKTLSLLEERNLPFTRGERAFNSEPDYLLTWKNAPFEHLYEVIDIISQLRTNKGEFPYYTSQGLSYFSDGLNCVTFCVRFLSKVSDINIDDVDSLKIYSDHENVTRKNYKFFPTDSEHIIEQLALNKQFIENPEIYEETIKRNFPKLVKRINWDNVN